MNIKFSPVSTEYSPLIYDILLPNLVGKSLTQACLTLKHLKLNYEIQGSGGFIIAQLPPAGTYVYKGQSIYLITN